MSSEADAGRLADRYRRELGSMRIKVVPDNDPNADGTWLTVEAGVGALSFERACEHLAQFVPAGHHIVQLDSQ